MKISSIILLLLVLNFLSTNPNLIVAIHNMTSDEHIEIVKTEAFASECKKFEEAKAKPTLSNYLSLIMSGHNPFGE